MAPVTGMTAVRVGITDVPGGVLHVDDGELSGSLAGPYRCVFQRAGLDIQLVPVPLQRGLYYLAHGELDALLPLAGTAERDKMASFAGELLRASYVFVTARRNPSRAAAGLRYGILRGFVGKVFVPESASVIEEVSTWAQLPQMLERDRIDAAVMPAMVAQTLLTQHKEAFFLQPAGSLPISMYVSSRNGHTESASRIKAAVAECHASLFPSAD